MGRSSFIMVRRSNGIHNGFMELDWFHFEQFLSGLDIFKGCRLVHRSGKTIKKKKIGEILTNKIQFSCLDWLWRTSEALKISVLRLYMTNRIIHYRENNGTDRIHGIRVRNGVRSTPCY